MELVTYAQEELQRAGLFDEDADYGPLIGDGVLDLVKVLADQGHSGMSAMLVLEVFDRVARYEPLTELSSDLDEWMDVTEYGDPNVPMWQSRRNPAVFSKDGGQTWYNINNKEHEPPENLNDLSNTTDALIWAKAFMRTIEERELDPSEDLMLTWFANAIETTKDHC